MMACCPTCHQPAPDSRLMVCLQTNVASFGGQTVQLRPREAEIAEIMRRAYPRSLSAEAIASRLYGVSDGSIGAVYVLTCHLRRKLATIGATIQHTHSTGYRLQFSEAA